MSSTNKEATIMKMETPPSSPPPPEHNSVNNQHDDDDNMETSPLPAVNNKTLSSSPPTSTNNFTSNSSLKVVPSSPIKNSSHPQSCAAPSTPLQSTTQSSFPTINHPSTPSDSEGDGLFGLNIAGGRHHGDDLTPIIRNVSYVESKSSSGGGISSGGGGGSRGVLRQRRLPLPRGSSGGLKPSSGSSSSKTAVRSSTGFFPATSPSVLGSGSSSGMLASVPSPPPSETEEEGMNKKSSSSSSLERKSPSLSLSTEDYSSPSSLAILPGMYSDDESSIESSSNRSNNKRGGVASIVRHGKKSKEEDTNNGRGVGGLFLAPIELKPDRKFFSFQGTSQYKSQVGGGVDTAARGGRPTPSLATIHSPPHRPLGEMGEYYSSPTTGGDSPKPYEPWARCQHGVTEMADTKELDAIFKSPRITRSPTAAGANASDGSAITTSLLHPTVVTPAKQEQEDEEEAAPTTTMITNLPPNQDPEFLQPFPLDDRQYSIPSIRLANAVHRSDSLASYEMYSRTFSDEDESTWEGSFYAGDEDDDVDTEASWSTSGSISSLRRRQFMRHLSSASSGGGGMMTSGSLEGMRHLNSSEGGEQQRMMSGSLEGLRHLNSSEGQQTNSSSSIPAIAPSNSFMERMQGITINQRSNTFESSSDAESYQGGGGPPVVLNVQSSNPALMINGTQSMDDAEYETRQDHRVRRSNHHSHRSARRRRSSHNRTSSAVEWIQGLQNPSNGGGVQIVEAASSKFLIGGTDGAGAEEAVATSEDVSKALGMPHPLCRSSTIEAGPFVNRAAAATTAATNGLNGIGE